MDKEQSIEKKRPVVAFINGNIHDIHSRRLVSEIYELLQEDDIEFHYYLGAELIGYLSEDSTQNLRAESHYYSLFSYLAFDVPDIIIVSMGGLCVANDSTSAEEFIASLPHVPVILLESDIVCPGVTHILLDNYQGMHDLVTHMIRDHGYRRFAHLAGPARNNDARLRLQAYRDALTENGIPVNEAGIVHGDFTANVRSQVLALLETRPQALLSANDVMAEACYDVIKDKGMRVGEDIAVTGFDDTRLSAYMDPPLTTVRQDYGLIAQAVVDQVRGYFRGQALEDINVPASLVCRCSCGCSITPAEISDKAQRRLMEHHVQMDQMVQQSIETAVTLRRMLFQELNQEGLFKEIGETLYRLGARRSLLLLHEKPLVLEQKELVKAPDQILLVMWQNGQSVISHDPETAPHIRQGALRDTISISQPTRLTDFVLYYQKYEYGVLSVDIDPSQLLFFYSLSLEIGSGMRYLQISMDRQSVRHALEEKNQILSYVASHDKLTGLYNRAGIMDMIFRYVRSFPEKQRFLLVMSDLDHLKQINDTFGHTAGDEALRLSGEILTRCFPEGSPIGRSGGDEFLGILPLTGPDQGPQLLESLRASCDRLNETEFRPYYIGLSTGYCPFGFRDLRSISSVMEKADHMLYEAKKKRRPSVLRDHDPKPV